MIVTAFPGHVLTWGQMSFWGAIVITSLASAIPIVGDTIVTWLWGGFSVDNATLNRASLLHLAALHQYGSNNPLGREGQEIIKDEMRMKAFQLNILRPALVSGLNVVCAKNPIHSISFPIPVFRDALGLLLLLGLDFFVMIFLVVYIGAIVVSFLFVVMMFHIQIAEVHEEVLRYLPVSGIIGLIFWWEMFFILDNESILLLPTQRNTTSLRYTVYAEKVQSWTNLKTLGNLLYTYYFVWVLVSSLILLVAMIGAILATRFGIELSLTRLIAREPALSLGNLGKMLLTFTELYCYSSKAISKAKKKTQHKTWPGTRLLCWTWIQFLLSCFFKRSMMSQGKHNSPVSCTTTTFLSRKTELSLN
ncbi:hypothetical protein V2J09_016040 [Rumex salicifolius]